MVNGPFRVGNQSVLVISVYLSILLPVSAAFGGSFVPVSVGLDVIFSVLSHLGIRQIRTIHHGRYIIIFLSVFGV